MTSGKAKIHLIHIITFVEFVQVFLFFLFSSFTLYTLQMISLFIFCSVTFSGSGKLYRYIQGNVYLFWQTNRIPQSKECLPRDKSLFTEASGGQLNVIVRSIRDSHKHSLTRFISVLMRYLRVFPVGSYKIGLCLYKTIWFDDLCYEIQDSKWNTLMKLKHSFDFFY